MENITHNSMYEWNKFDNLPVKSVYMESLLYILLTASDDGNPVIGAMNVTNNILSSQNNEIAINDRHGPLAQIEHRGLFPGSSTLPASEFYQHQVERLLSQETVSDPVLLKLAELVPTDHKLITLGVHLNIPIHKVSHLYTLITHL